MVKKSSRQRCESGEAYTSVRNIRHVCAAELTVRGEQEETKMASISSEGSVSSVICDITTIVFVLVGVDNAVGSRYLLRAAYTSRSIDRLDIPDTTTKSTVWRQQLKKYICLNPSFTTPSAYHRGNTPVQPSRQGTRQSKLTQTSRSQAMACRATPAHPPSSNTQYFPTTFVWCSTRSSRHSGIRG